MTQTFEEAGMEELLNKGRRSGHVSAGEVLAAIPEAEGNRERLSSIVSQLSENGITVRVDNDVDRGAGAVVEAARRIVDEAVGIDDPVRMYLREIGKVTLLTAEDERRLARAMEEWIHVDVIRDTLRKELGHEASHSEVLVGLFREFHQERAVYQAVSRHLDLPRQSVSERIVDTKFRGTIDRELDEEAHLALMKEMKWDEERAHQALIRLSIITHIMRPEQVHWAAEISGGESKVFPPPKGLAAKLEKAHGGAIRYYFEKVIRRRAFRATADRGKPASSGLGGEKIHRSRNGFAGLDPGRQHRPDSCR